MLSYKINIHQHTSTPPCSSLLASCAYTHTVGWNILAMLLIPSLLSLPLLPPLPPLPPLPTCMPPSHVSHCWRYRWKASASLQSPCLCLPQYTADRGPHPHHSDGPALPLLLHQVTKVIVSHTSQKYKCCMHQCRDCNCFTRVCHCLTCRGGVAGPAGPAKAGPLFSESLVSFSDCRDSLRTRRLGQVSHTPCMYAFLVIVPTLLPADREPRPDCIDTHAF